MKCPNDDTTLVMSERSGIEIDYCPQCRGVWLDRGELDKIVERSISAEVAGAPTKEHFGAAATLRDEYHPPQKDEHYRKRKKESFLGDLFDF